MRVLVCGGRYYSQRNFLFASLDKVEGITLLIHGDARGADRLARDWANARGVPVQAFPANWTRYGRAAGSIRNEEMLVVGRPDLVISFPGGVGTADMVRRARKAGVTVMEPS